GEPSWRRLVLPTKDGGTFHSVTFYGRDVYALRDNGRLDVFKEMGRGDYKLARDVALAPASCCTSFQQYFHLKCDEHSLRVIVGKFGESVE
nr:Toll/interleukin-1 receptor (TIR) domain-containing protein [Tanacetum cinerariifolium]